MESKETHMSFVDRQKEKEATGFFTRTAIKAFVVIGGLVFVGTVISKAVTPELNDLETKGTEHSYTFVQTKKELLTKLVSDYRKLETQQVLNKSDADVTSALEGQKKSIVDRIRLEASSLPRGEVPAEVQPFLN
jgi:hypothetical protein